ncbi:alpha/beta fold hydrolase [Marinobacterium aestuariivivens]|uniref:Alpha/beta fold hydrolase n=1 Tax=Marinobacterium aestuariivivens TaxID=1698799 RepID=A0ABW1ZUQ3_9GAMM
MLWPLTGAFRLISPDIPGQAGLSAEVPPDRDGGYGRWLLSMLDGLGIERCAMVGISFGGAVVLDAIRLAPLRVERASLIVPAGLEISLWRTLKATLRPWLSYRWHRDDPHFAALMKPLMAEPWPELCQFYQAVLSDLHPPVRVPPGPFSAAELRHFDGAVQLVLARHDLYFEPEALEAAAREALPKLSDILLLDDSHIPGRNSRRELHQRVLAFLADSGR